MRLGWVVRVRARVRGQSRRATRAEPTGRVEEQAEVRVRVRARARVRVWVRVRG